MRRWLNLLLLLLIAGFVSAQTTKEPQRLFYINSYHEGYGSSDDIEEAIRDYFLGLFVKVKTFYMDTKRYNSEEAIKFKVEQALEEIEEFEPDVIIASDDNAVNHIIEPYFKGSDIPVVFCGVNWSAEKYGLPTENVTGMIEVLPIDQSVNTLKEYYPDMATVTVISENTLSDKNNQEYIVKIFKDLGLETNYVMVDDIHQWKEAFVKANANSDLIFLPTNGAIKEWNTGVVHEFVKETIKKPVFTCDDFMMPYCAFGLTKVASEQGEWAAQTALKIIRGASPDQFEVTKNDETKAYFNPVVSDRLGFEPKQELKEKSEIIIRHK